MNLKEERYRLTVEPKTEVEIAYIEEVLKLTKDGDFCKLVRRNAMGLGCIAYLETNVIERGGVEAWRPRTLEEFISESSNPDYVAVAVGKFAKRMFNHMSNCGDMPEIQKQLTRARKSKNWVEVAVIALVLEGLKDDKEA